MLDDAQQEIADGLAGVERSRYVRRMGRAVVLPREDLAPEFDAEANGHLPVRKRTQEAKGSRPYVCVRCGAEAHQRDPAAWCPACGLGKLVSSGSKPVTRRQIERRIALLAEAERISLKMELWSLCQHPAMAKLLAGRYKWQQLAVVFEAMNVPTRERKHQDKSQGVPF